MGSKNRTVLAISHDDAWLNHPQAKVFDIGSKRWMP
jgi:hypothetical protein